MSVREKLSSIEIWPEGDHWRWQILRFSAGGTRTVARGTASSEAGARQAAWWRALHGNLWLAVAGVAALAGALVWLMK